MSRYVDYEFEPFTGYLLFRAPVSSLDPELNPISIRVTYETQTDGDSFWIYGADAQAKVSKTLEVGGATIQDDNPQGHSSLNSINSTVKLTEHTSLVGEVAQSNYEDASGTAERLEIKHHKGNSDARVYYSQTGENFTNAASTIMSGRIESGFKASQKVAKSTTLVSQGILSENLYTSGETKGVIAGVVQQVGRTSVEVGARHSETTKDPNHVGLPNQPSEINSLRTKVKTPIPKIPATIYAEYENDVKDTDKRMLAIGADYQLKNKARFYARHELISTLGSPYELNSSQQQNTTVAGLETEYMRNGHVFNEYRNRDALTGRDMETATGLRNLWTLSDNLKLNTSFERISPISTGADKNEATAGALGLEYTPDAKSKATTRLEVRDAVANDTILNTIGYARKLSKDWTFLSKSIFMDQISKDINAGDRVQMRFQTGLAYRQTEQDKWNGLTKYEYRQENDQTNLKLPIDRTVHIISSDINYQPTADWELSAHYAVKLATESDAITTAHLLGGRLSYFISKKLDIGFGAYTLANLNFSQQKYAFGPELGYIIHQNLRLGIGYNIQGFKDHDLGESYTAPGVFINIRIKFGHEAIN